MKSLKLTLLKLAAVSGLLISGFDGHAQKSAFSPDAISFRTGNISSSFPIVGVSSLFRAPYRPYFEISATKAFGKKEKQVWEHELNLGYFYHRFLQHGIPLHYNVVRKFHVGEKIILRTKLGAGYLHSMSAVDRFRLNDAGEYEKIRSIGRPQAMFDLGLECGYKLNDQMALSLQYKTLLQTPFIKSYVPLLPYNSAQLGLIYTLKNNAR